MGREKCLYVLLLPSGKSSETTFLYLDIDIENLAVAIIGLHDGMNDSYMDDAV